MRRFCRRWLADTKGATAVEYGLICALIVIVATVGIKTLGSSNAGSWGYIYNKVAAVTPS